MPLIIDGYNLIHGIGLLPASVRKQRYEPGRLAEARNDLLTILTRGLNPTFRSQTTVVFDAIEPPEFLPDSFRFEGLRIYFARGYRDADEYIIEQITARNRNQSMTIISSDHQIQKYAKRKKFDYFDSDNWYYSGMPYSPGKTASAAGNNSDKQRSEKPPKISEEEVEYWRQIFDP